MSALFAAQLKAVEERIMLKIEEVAADVTNLHSDLKLLSGKVTVLDKRIDNVAFDVDKLKAAANVIEKDKISSDLIVYNIPNDVDALNAAEKIVATLPVKDLSINHAFRTKNISDKTVKPIIIKLRSADDRSKLFRALAEFRNNNKRQLKLSDIGLKGETTIVMHECLSPATRELLNSAIRFKKSQLLFATFTLRGQLFVKKSADGAAIKITDLATLNKFVS